MKALFWRLVYALYPYTRNFLLRVGVLTHYSRQPYRLGYIREDRSVEELRRYLITKGFHPNPMAWVDPGETLNVRKLLSPHYQYHIRVFSNHEVKGHFECTPERHPIAHLNELAMLPAKEYFDPLLQDWVRPTAPSTAPVAVSKEGNTDRQTASATSTGSP